jgi:hypothetical protein
MCSHRCMEPPLEIEGYFNLNHGCRPSEGAGEAGGVGSCRPAKFHDAHSTQSARAMFHDITMFLYWSRNPNITGPETQIRSHHGTGPIQK